MSTRFLLDANLSPRTATFLSERFGFDVVDLLTLGLNHYRDREVAELAVQQSRVIITFDLGFGALYHRYFHRQVGVIILRLDDQKSSSVNQILSRFFETRAPSIDLERSLVVIDEHRVRVSTSPQQPDTE